MKNSKMGRKVVDIKMKRRLHIKEIQEKYGKDLSARDIAGHLKSDYNEEVSHITVLSDIEYNRTHTISESTLNAKKTDLMISREGLINDLKYNLSLREEAKENGTVGDKILIEKVIVDIRNKIISVEKTIEELKIQDVESRTEWKYFNFAEPKLADTSNFKDKLSPKSDTKD